MASGCVEGADEQRLEGSERVADSPKQPEGIASTSAQSPSDVSPSAERTAPLPDREAEPEDPRPTPTNVTFQTTLEARTYVWVPEDEAWPMVPPGWVPSCHEYDGNKCVYRGLISELTILYVEFSRAWIGEELIEKGRWASLLLNVETPATASSDNDILDVDWIHLATLTDSPEARSMASCLEPDIGFTVGGAI
jgi:hypothetical protein